MIAKRIGHITSDTLDKLIPELNELFRHSVPSFGKQVVNLGYDYTFSGRTIPKAEWGLAPDLYDLMGKVNKQLGLDFNSALINWYPVGKPVKISAHQDIEPCLDSYHVVSVSIGENSDCDFVFRDKRTKAIVQSSTLKHCDVFYFDDEMNLACTHEIPPGPSNGRVSITFRKFK